MTPNARLAGLILILLPFTVTAQDVTPPAQEAAETAAAPTAEPELPVTVRVTGVETLNDYAAVSRTLAAASGVKRVDVTEAEGSAVTFRVTVRGGSPALEQALQGAGQLTRSGASGGRLVYELKR